MKLVFTPNPHYIHMVLVVAHEAGVLGRLQFERQVPFDADTRISDYNPLGKVPTLVLDDGRSLYGGLLICEYLESLAARPTHSTSVRFVLPGASVTSRAATPSGSTPCSPAIRTSIGATAGPPWPAGTTRSSHGLPLHFSCSGFPTAMKSARCRVLRCNSLQ